MAVRVGMGFDVHAFSDDPIEDSHALDLSANVGRRVRYCPSAAQAPSPAEWRPVAAILEK